jgi:hypothetical protein
MRIVCPLLALSAVTLCAFTGFAQQNTAPQRLMAARPLYYTPTTAGLKTLHCNVTMDWKAFLNSFSTKPLADDNPALIYLNSTKLTLDDDLHGKGLFTWTDTTSAPEAFALAAKKMADGMAQMFDAYFQAWNQYMNGSMVPAPDKTVTVVPDGDGIKLSGLDDKKTVTEKFDKNMLLTESRVADANSDEVDVPTFADTPNGRILTNIHMTMHQPPSAPPTLLDITTTYAKVGPYQLPASVTFAVQNVGTFLFNISGCQVNP